MTDGDLTPAHRAPAWQPPKLPPVPPLGHEPRDGTRPTGPLTDTVWSVGAALWLVAAFALLLFLAAAVASGAGRLLDLREAERTLAATGLISVAYLLTIGIVALMARGRGVPLAAAIGLRRVGGVSLLVMALVAALLGRVLASVWGLLLQVLGVDVSSADLDPTKLFAPGPLGVLMLVTVTIVLAPIVEEVIFRGILLPALAARWGAGTAVVVSSAAFALVHLHLAIIPAIFIFAVVLGRLFIHSRSLLVCIVAHAMFNAMGLAAFYALKGMGVV